MTRFALLFGCALMLAACFAGNPPSGTAALASPAEVTALPTTTAATPSVGPTVVPTLLPTPVPGSGLCPTDSPLTVRQLVFTDALLCFGRSAVRVRGWLDLPPSIGFEPPSIEPGWVYYPAPDAPTIWEAKPAGRDNCEVDGEQCAWFFPHINPASGLTLDGPPRWLILTGHYLDPAAETCHWVYPDDWPDAPSDTPESRAAAVALCRQGFVLDSFVDAP